LEPALQVTLVTPSPNYARSRVLAKDVFIYQHDSFHFVEGAVNPAKDVMSTGFT
jgi:hypothetical protein